MTTTQNKHTFNYLQLQPTRTIYVYGIFTNKIYIEIYIHLKNTENFFSALSCVDYFSFFFSRVDCFCLLKHFSQKSLAVKWGLCK